jgi:hypothetical protein
MPEFGERKEEKNLPPNLGRYRHVPRWGIGVVDSLDSRRGAASCMAMVAPSPPFATRRVAEQTRMLLLRHVGKTSSSSPPPGEPTAVVVVVALRGGGVRLDEILVAR